MRRIVTALSAVALAFSLVSLATPANAVAGYDSQYAGESAFLTLSPGGSGTFTVFFANTGTTSWVKGTASQVDLATCLGDKTTCNAQDATEAGFNPGTWLSTTRYATHSQTTVAPGQIGTFTFDVKVPATAVPGVNRFNGALVLSASGADIHNEGYYQDVQVTVAVTIAITSCGTSPSSATTTTVTGTGAGAAASVAIKDGTTQIATATADSTGAFTASVSGLTEGAHSFTAVTTQQTSPACTLTVDLTKPKVSSAAAASLTQVDVTFNENMDCTSLGSGNYTVKDISGTAINATTPSGGGSSQISAAGRKADGTSSTAKDCTVVRITLTNALTNGTQYTVTVNSGVNDAAGNTIDTSANSATFVASDTTSPTLSSAAYRSTTVVRFTFSEPMNNSATGAGTANVANYTFDGTAGSAAFSACTLGSSDTTADCTLAGTATFAAGNHTFTVGNVQDKAGNTITPNPTSTTITFPPTTTRPTVTGVSSPNLSQIFVTYSTRMNTSGAGTGCANAANYALQKSDGTSASPASVTGSTISCSSTTNIARITLLGGSAVVAGTSYQLVITGVTDAFGNVITPNPTTSAAFTAAADTTVPTVSSAVTPTVNTNPCTPAITNAAANTAGPCNQTVMTITFSEAMNPATTGAGIANTANYSIGNSQGITDASCAAGTTDGTTFTAAATGNATAVVCVFAPTALQAGTYVVTVSNVQDLSGNTIAASSTVSLVVTDSTRPVANMSTTNTSTTGASAGPTSATVVINFTSASAAAGATTPADFMSQAGGSSGTNSVLNFANFKIDNTTLTSSNTTSIVCSNTTTSGASGAIACNTITITLPGNSTSLIGGLNSAHSIQISNVQDTGGTNINPNPTTIGFVTG